MNPDLEFIRQQHESFLNDLEALAVQALVTRDWAAVYQHIARVSSTKVDLSDSFKSEQDFVEAIAFINRLLGSEASAKTLARSGADLLPHTEQTSATGD